MTDWKDPELWRAERKFGAIACLICMLIVIACFVGIWWSL